MGKTPREELSERINQLNLEVLEHFEKLGSGYVWTGWYYGKRLDHPLKGQVFRIDDEGNASFTPLDLFPVQMLEYCERVRKAHPSVCLRLVELEWLRQELTRLQGSKKKKKKNTPRLVAPVGEQSATR